VDEYVNLFFHNDSYDNFSFPPSISVRILGLESNPGCLKLLVKYMCKICQNLLGLKFRKKIYWGLFFKTRHVKYKIIPIASVPFLLDEPPIEEDNSLAIAEIQLETSPF
jgi:hypothetical protein